MPPCLPLPVRQPKRQDNSLSINRARVRYSCDKCFAEWLRSNQGHQINSDVLSQNFSEYVTSI